MKKIYYKVVRHYRDQLISSNSSSGTCNGTVVYSAGVVIKPDIRGSCLFVFDNYNDAKSLASLYQSGSIMYECHVTNPRKAPEHGTIWNDKYQQFWNVVNRARKAKKSINRAIKEAGNFYDFFPKETIWCDSLTLTKQIQ